MKKILFLTGLVTASLFSSAANVYWYPAAYNNESKIFQNTDFINDAGTNVAGFGATVDLRLDATKTGFKNGMGIQIGGGTYQINSFYAKGLTQNYTDGAGVSKYFYGMKTFGSSDTTGYLKVTNNFTLEDSYFNFARAKDSPYGWLEIGGQIQMGSTGSESVLNIGQNAASDTTHNNNLKPITKLTVGYVADDVTGDKISLISSGTKSSSLYLNVGSHDTGSSVTDLSNPDVTFNGVVKKTGSGALFLYLLNRTNVEAGTMSVSTQGMDGFISTANLGTPSNISTEGIYQMSTLIFNNEKSYKHTGALSDTQTGWGFAEKVKTAIVMQGASGGTQILSGFSISFSGGVNVKSGTLLVAGNKTGCNNTVYTHGILNMQGGKFGFYTDEGAVDGKNAGVFTFKDADILSSTLQFGVYDDGVDQLQIVKTGDSEGKFAKGDTSNPVNVTIEIVGADSDIYNNLVASSVKIISWDSYDSDINFISGDIELLGNLYKAVFSTTQGDGLYMQYVAVPEPASIAALFGFFALALVVIRKRK